MNKYFLKEIEKRSKDMEDWFAEKQSTLTLPADVLIDSDIPYSDDGLNCHKTDVYYTAPTDTLRPVIFSFHGGGLVSCERKVNQWFACEMARRGFVVFCIDYPLVPQADLYTILRDSYAGIVNACARLEKYHGDPDRLFLCGDSAGGFISTYLAALQNNPAIAQSLQIKTANLTFRAVAAISGMFFSSKVDKQGIFILRKAFYGKQYKKHPFWQYVDPLQNAITDFLPPGIYITAKKDYLRDYTIRFIEQLRRSANSFVLEDYQDNDTLTHDFVCLMPETDEARDAMDKIADFFSS